MQPLASLLPFGSAVTFEREAAQAPPGITLDPAIPSIEGISGLVGTAISSTVGSSWGHVHRWRPFCVPHSKQTRPGLLRTKLRNSISGFLGSVARLAYFTNLFTDDLVSLLAQSSSIRPV
jgi:hypothetical protein